MGVGQSRNLPVLWQYWPEGKGFEAAGDSRMQLLADFWNGSESGAPPPHDFFARTYLQPYAVGVRTERSGAGRHLMFAHFANGNPGLGVLRPLGDGGQRSLGGRVEACADERCDSCRTL